MADERREKLLQILEKENACDLTTEEAIKLIEALFPTLSPEEEKRLEEIRGLFNGITKNPDVTLGATITIPLTACGLNAIGYTKFLARAGSELPWLLSVIERNGVTAINARKTHCKRGHPLSGSNLLPRPLGRNCRECNRADCRNYRARRKAHAV